MDLYYRVVAERPFNDGNLAEQFEAEGQRLPWRLNEERVISEALYQRCLRSGAQLAVREALVPNVKKQVKGKAKAEEAEATDEQ